MAAIRRLPLRRIPWALRRVRTRKSRLTASCGRSPWMIRATWRRRPNSTLDSTTTTPGTTGSRGVSVGGTRGMCGIRIPTMVGVRGTDGILRTTTHRTMAGGAAIIRRRITLTRSTAIMAMLPRTGCADRAMSGPLTQGEATVTRVGLIPGRTPSRNRRGHRL